jgi:membrane associated rhomboid family serine protease
MILILPSEAEYRAERWPLVTFTLLGICTGVFVLEIIAGVQGSWSAFIRALGLIPGDPHWWAWLTAVWVHGGLLHFLGNMAYLWIFGATVEDRLGRAPFACLYFASGLIGNAAQVALGSAAGALSPIIGASGAIAGCMGAFLLLLGGTRIRLHYMGWFFVPFRGDWWVRGGTLMGIWIGLNVLNAVLTWGDSTAGGTAYWCHIGGFATGAALAYFGGRAGTSEAPKRILDGETIAGPFSVTALRQMTAAGSLSAEAMVESSDGNWELLADWIKQCGNDGAGNMRHGWLAVATLAAVALLGAWWGTARSIASGEIATLARQHRRGAPLDSKKLLELSRQAGGPAKAWGQWTGNLQKLVENESAAASNALRTVIRTRDEGLKNGWPSNSISVYRQQVREAIGALKTLEPQVQKLPSRFDEAIEGLKSSPRRIAQERQRLERAVQSSLVRLEAQRGYLESVDAHCLLVDIHDAKYNLRTRRWEARDPQGRQALQRAELEMVAKARALQALR